MSREAMVPCFTCGTTLGNVAEEAVNQPDGGTEFRTYGHYGSTFWDSFDGEQIIVNICDECLREHTDRILRLKRFRRVVSSADRQTVGRRWLNRYAVPWFDGDEDNDQETVDPEDVGTDIPGIEWSGHEPV